MKKWKEEEIKTLFRYYNKVSNKDLQLMLGRSWLSIYKKARKLGIYKTKENAFLNKSIGRDPYKRKLGSRKRTRYGYIQIYMPSHHRADSLGFVMEHIYVYEQSHQTTVPLGYVVHHINGVKDDNRSENLVMMSAGEHSSLHDRGRKLSDDTKAKISQRTKLRLKDKTKHPSYKPVNVAEMIALRDKGVTVKDICKRFGINRSTYYNKVRNYE